MIVYNFRDCYEKCNPKCTPKYFLQQDEIKNSLSPFNLIPKKNVRTKNRSNQKLLIKHLYNNYEDKKVDDENDSESDYNNSFSRDNKKIKTIGDYKNNNLYNYPSKKDVGLYSCEEENYKEDEDRY